MMSFKIPSLSEGFDEVVFGWESEECCVRRLETFVDGMKLSCKILDLKPGSWFKDKETEWSKKMKEWQGQNLVRKMESANAPKADAAKDANAEDAPCSMDYDDEIDVMSIENVFDVGNGKPIFSRFLFENWVLFQ